MKSPIDLTVENLLENDRVQLRPLRDSDYNNLLKFSLEEPELWSYSLVSAAGEEGLKNYLDIANSNRTLQREYPFIVYDKVQGKYAGSTRFYDILPDYNTVQLGYTWYGKQFHGTGLNKNCKFLLLQFAFETWQVERVEFRADNDNAKSIAAMKSIGAKVDGILRSNMPRSNGGRRDSIVLSILKDEWFGGVKDTLRGKL